MVKVTVIDSVMGSGKTSWAIAHMNEAPTDRKFIFITPFLDEIERVRSAVMKRQFISPDNDNVKGRKMYDLKQLIVQGADICATHSLFRDADDELVELLTDAGYTLILDEAMDVVERVNIGPQDIRSLLMSQYIKIEENRVIWLFDEYNDARFSDIKRLAKAGNLFIYRDNFLVWTFPPRVFAVFEEVYSMTYLFNGQLQRYYFDLHGIAYEYRSVRKTRDYYELCDYDVRAENREELYALIEVYDGKLNDIGRRKNVLSSGWLDRANGDVIGELKRNLYTYLRSHCEASAGEIIWTTLKDYRHQLKGKGFADSFLAVNARATNEYADRWALAYIYNRYMNPQEKTFFQENGIQVDEEALAVSDLLQWIWRSRIRNGQPIKLYLPSSRMRSLLRAWANYEI
ncbi:hypothetical protein [Paenibacillus ehimensis]|uniref:hypothetical protein n=1 Tax=Paenibacillus ehimensis TaxID=79264 RepID=UPI000FD88EAC|nr:hypothetical protein [Paenibacillus ehimensis]